MTARTPTPTPPTNGTPAAAAKSWLARGVFTIPLPPRSKRPTAAGWPDLRLTAEEIDRQFRPDSNVGVLLGAPSGGLVDVDLDCPEAIAAAPLLLPATGLVGGRRSAPTSHWWYVVDAPPAAASTAADDPAAPSAAGRRLVELRSTGGQTVIAPSIYPADDTHPKAEPCVWHQHGEPARVPIAELSASVREVAAAALLGRYWPGGARHDAALALAGGLLRAGWERERVEIFVRAVCAAAGDTEVTDRIAAVRDTVSALAQGEPATGWPSLVRILGQRGETVVSKVRDWLALPERTPATAADTAPDAPPPWPDPPHPAAYHGVAGDLVRAIEPASESDPAAILGQTLVAFGSIIGRTAHFEVERDRHYTNEFVVLVGQSSKARKGTSRGQVNGAFVDAERLADASPSPDSDDIADPAAGAPDTSWSETRNQSGLSSGEGLIWAVRDSIETKEKIKEKGEAPRYENVISDDGVKDKRLLVFEPEFASVLKQTERQGNTLSTACRQAWESGDLRTLTKHSPAKATGAHISLVGHITAEELRRYLTVTEFANGFGNRFMWLAVRRSKLLPEGGRPDEGALADITRRLAAAIRFGRGQGLMRRDAQAREIWHEVYGTLSADRPGLAGVLLGRAEAHVMRLAMIYALLDCSASIGADHLTAAMALWDYAERSVLYVFSDSLGDPLADDLARLIRQAGERGITRTDIATHLGRNMPADRIGRALGMLMQHGRAHRREERAGEDDHPSDGIQVMPPRAGISSFISFIS